jgi:hypothetical protein
MCFFNGQVVPVNGSKLTPLLGLEKNIGKFGARQEKVASSVLCILCDKLLSSLWRFCYSVNVYSCPIMG